MAKEEFQKAGPTFTVNYYHPGKPDPVAQVDHISADGDSCVKEPLIREWVAAAGAALLVDAEALPVKTAQRIDRIEVESSHLTDGAPTGRADVRVRAAGYAFSDMMSGDTRPSLRPAIQQLDWHWQRNRPSM